MSSFWPPKSGVTWMRASRAPKQAHSPRKLEREFSGGINQRFLHGFLDEDQMGFVKRDLLAHIGKVRTLGPLISKMLLLMLGLCSRAPHGTMEKAVLRTVGFRPDSQFLLWNCF